MPVLVIARGIQGLSGSLLWTAGLAVLIDAVGSNRIGVATGYIGFTATTGILAGPSVGGILFGWRGEPAVFLFAFALLALDTILRFVMIETVAAAKWKTHRQKDYGTAREPDGENGSAKSVKPSTLNGEHSSASENEEENPDEQTPLIDAEHTEQVQSQSANVRRPAIFTLLKDVRIIAVVTGSTMQSILTTSFDPVLPLFVRDTFGFGPYGAGLIFLALFTPGILDPALGWLVDRYGPNWLAALGLMCAAPALLLMRLVYYDSVSQIALLCVLLGLTGLSLNCVTPVSFTVLSKEVEKLEEEDPGRFGEAGAFGEAYGLFNGGYAFGMLVGPIFSGTIKEKAGWPTLTATMAAMSAVTAVFIVRKLTTWIQQEKAP